VAFTSMEEGIGSKKKSWGWLQNSQESGAVPEGKRKELKGERERGEKGEEKADKAFHHIRGDWLLLGQKRVTLT